MPTFTSRHFLSAIIAMGLPSTGLASPQTQANQSPEIVTVTATRTPQKTSSVGASVSVVDAEQIAALGAISIVDVLQTLPGVNFSRNGGVGSLTSVRIRGAEADQTVLLIDGVPLNDPSTPGGGYNFGNLLVGDLDRVEVLRGPQSTLYGSQAIGGVVNLVTREPATVFEGNATAEFGDLDTQNLRAAVRGSIGALRYSFGAGHFETGGVSSAASGTERDGFENNAAQARLIYRLSPTLSLEGRAWLSAGDVGIDGFPPPSFSLADTAERSKTDERILYGAANLTLLEGRWRMRFSASQARTDRDNLDLSRAFPLTFTARGQNDRIEAHSVFELTPTVQIMAGFEDEQSEFATASPSQTNPNPVPATARVNSQGLYAQIQATPIEGLTAALGVRQTQHERFGEALNTRATVAWGFNGGNTIVRAALADGFKAPTLFQLFSSFGNTSLQPEEASSAEFGIEQGMFARKLVASVTWFERTTTNQIDFISCFNVALAICTGRPFGTYSNIARTKADGLEAMLEAKPNTALTLSAGYSSLKARNITPASANFGKNLARRPDETLFVTASYAFGPKREISVTYAHTGAAFDNGANTVPLAAYDLLAVRANWAMSEHWSIFARIENAQDEVYQTTALYNAPPRQAFVGLRADF